MYPPNGPPRPRRPMETQKGQKRQKKMTKKDRKTISLKNGQTTKLQKHKKTNDKKIKDRVQKESLTS